MRNEVGIEWLVGKTILRTDGAAKDDRDVRLWLVGGQVFNMFHPKNCCADVRIDSVVGKLNDLVGQVITEASESDDSPDGWVPPPLIESFTWSCIKISTATSTVEIRWLGQSNGYYGEDVSFEVTEPTPGV